MSYILLRIYLYTLGKPLLSRIRNIQVWRRATRIKIVLVCVTLGRMSANKQILRLIPDLWFAQVSFTKGIGWTKVVIIPLKSRLHRLVYDYDHYCAHVNEPPSALYPPRLGLERFVGALQGVVGVKPSRN